VTPVLEIEAFLKDAGFGTPKENLFHNQLPDGPSVCTAVFATGGLAPEAELGSTEILEESPSFQLRFRGEPYDADGPMVRALAAYTALAAVQAQELSGTFYHWIVPQQPPSELERDGKGRVVVAFNVLCEKEPSEP